MKMIFPALSALLLLTSCAVQEETQCVESLYCCSYTCVTEQEDIERGPDGCDCLPESEPTAPEGTCSAVEGVCDWR
jgi:hypothetical protein